MSKYTFFWKEPFSQWYKSPFTVNGIVYNCAEQYMMHQKAILFGDHKAALNIMQADHPRDQKTYGRGVIGFDEKIWNNIARSIVYTGNYAKFTQSAFLGDLLEATEGTILVEASPYDRIWGIGYAANDAMANFNNWGLNWLGEVLTTLRNDLYEK